MDNTVSKESTPLSVAVRDFILVHRRGSLSSANLDHSDDLEAKRLHKLFTRLLRGEENLTTKSNSYADFIADWRTDIFCVEMPFTWRYEQAHTILNIKGRIDHLSIQNHKLHLFEVKTFQGDVNLIPKQGYNLHRAQLLIYAAYLLHVNPATLADQFISKYLSASEEKKKSISFDHNLAITEHTLLREQIIEAITNFQKDPLDCLHLTYMSVDAPEIMVKTLTLNRQEILKFLYHTAELYHEQLSQKQGWQKLRNQANTKAKFPFRELRKGQPEFMEQALSAITHCEALLVAAPTGIGKTISALYPALKAQTRNLCQKIFYTTAMNTTRLAAADALAHLRNNGFRIRSLLLKAKEASCLAKDIYCDHNVCPYARNYYQRLPQALSELLKLEDVRPENINEVAQNHQLCPFELSLDFAEYCDVVIGDYNHVFDPRVKLSRFINEQSKSCLLIDEAHNLPERANIMYSAVLKLSELETILRALEQIRAKNHNLHAVLYSRLSKLIVLLKSVQRLIDSDDYEGKISIPNQDNTSNQTYDPAEILFKDLPPNIVRNYGFIGARSKPDKLLADLGNLLFHLRIFLKENTDCEDKRIFEDIFYQILHFIRIGAYYFDDAYLTYMQIDPENRRDLSIVVDCLDASNKITQNYLNQHAAIFFSATLKPLDYYAKLLSSDKARDYGIVNTLNLPSPFPAEHRFLATISSFSMKYQDRELTASEIAEFILDVCSDRKGNYLVFVPSFKYLHLIASELRELTALRKELGEALNTRIIFQRSQMNIEQRQEFLSQFQQSSEKSLIGFAVLGSHFNEGIDLPGKFLSGVIVLSCGLPQPDIKRQIIADYYQHKFENGYLYAYIYPGFNKLEQAVGRLIRSETDTGFALLLDHRYSEPIWRSLLPEDWHANNYAEVEDLLVDLHEFHNFISENDDV